MGYEGGTVFHELEARVPVCVCAYVYVLQQYAHLCVQLSAPAHMPFEKLHHPSIQPTRSVNTVCLSERPGVVGLMSTDEVPLVS